VEVKGSSKLSVVAYATAVDGREVKLKFPKIEVVVEVK
jgi:hypothetical protein